MQRGKRLLLLALRLVARARMKREDFQKFRRLLRVNPESDDERFVDCLLLAVAVEMEEKAGLTLTVNDSGELVAVEGVGSLWEWIRLLLDNWETIAKIILFIIALF